MNKELNRIRRYEGDWNDASLASETVSLWFEQYEEWPLLKKNNDNLKEVEIKKIDFGSFEVLVQFNPHRVKSSSAKVDKETLKKRKCFLCPANLPEEQKGVLVGNEFMILANPYPIFHKHLTIPAVNHVPQKLVGNEDVFLDLIKLLSPAFTLFYNGPKCGASAPDHFHFQACERFVMPVERELAAVPENLLKEIYSAANLRIFEIENYLRPGFVIRSNEKHVASSWLKRLFSSWEKKEDEIEPMMNVIGYFSDEEWNVIVFPRKEHRPKQFFLPGEDQLLLSPASVDMGGILITPIEKDYAQMDKPLIKDIFHQVCQTQKFIAHLTSSFLP